MVVRRSLIPYHFGIPWSILPNRTGNWAIVAQPGLVARLTTVAANRPSVVVSGDCMAALAAHREGLPLVWFDAHGDYQTMETTLTGAIGGMPLAMLCGEGDQTIMSWCGRGRVSPKDVYHVGGSEFDPYERERMVRDGVIVKDGEAPLTFVNTPIHLHIDTDVISSRDVPCSIHPAPNGMRLDAFMAHMDRLLPTAEVLSIKSFDPRLDVSGLGERVILDVLRRHHEARLQYAD